MLLPHLDGFSDAQIKKSSTGNGVETDGSARPVSNVIPGSGTATDPVADVVTQWGSPDSSGVWIRKDSLSNGKVTYSKRNVNSTSKQKSNKNEFQRAWNNW